MSTLTLTVTGMHCGSCGMLIDDALEELPGVHASRTSVRKGTTVIEHDGEVATEKLLEAVAELGYRAQAAG